MHYYVRYFDDETLVDDINGVIEFLENLPELNVTDDMRSELVDYANSTNLYPKRYKVRSRIYFIVIKTEAATMQDFKDKKAVRKMDPTKKPTMSQKELETQRLNVVHEGWYEASLFFKRVVLNEHGKCEYRETDFAVRCVAKSPMHCYERICEYLLKHVDKRSQFPTPRGNNFKYKFLGLAKLCKDEA